MEHLRVFFSQRSGVRFRSRAFGSICNKVPTATPRLCAHRTLRKAILCRRLVRSSLRRRLNGERMSMPNAQPGFYRARQPRRCPLHQLLHRHFSQFEAVYAQRYGRRYGVWRDVMRTSVEGYLKCGDVHEGFARLRCADCQHEMFVAFSCRTQNKRQRRPNASKHAVEIFSSALD